MPDALDVASEVTARTCTNPAGGIMSEWKPIETAPKDGTVILISELQGISGSVGTRWWHTVVAANWGKYSTAVSSEIGWCVHMPGWSGLLRRPISWQPFPLPDPPTQQTAQPEVKP